MKQKIELLLVIFSLTLVIVACNNYRKLRTDEIVFKDGSSQIGTIIKCDTAKLELKKMDESLSIIDWSNVDSVRGKKLKSIFIGANFGYHNIPYFSVFKNEKMEAKSFGMQYKIGIAYRGNKLVYFHLSYAPAKPYSVRKIGFGFQKYLFSSNYLNKQSYFTGIEINLLKAKYNNGPQTTLEPFIGFEKKINEHFRINIKLALQVNIANKNSDTGVNITFGLQAIKRNFNKYYTYLNSCHQLPKK